MIDHNLVILDLETRRDAINTAVVLLRALYGMPATGAPQSPTPPANTRRVYRRKPAVVEPLVDTETGRSSPVQAAILQVLKARPMTSIETFEAVKKAGVQTTAGSVYQTLRLLFSKDQVVKGKDDIGTLTWALS
jgi:hypothetical protein